MYGEVTTVERLSPSMVRVCLSGGELDQFEPSTATDAYLNARFIPKGSPITVPFETSDLDDVDPEMKPRPRRFTVRKWDDASQTLTIDFVAHGDQGYAGAWAQRAKPGDRLQFNNPRGSYTPSPLVDWHLLAGDESALPAIAASLESLSADSSAHVFVVVDGPEHELTVDSAADVSIHWLHRASATDPETLLVDAIAAAEFPAGTYDVFVHGEAEETVAVRKHLVAERGVDIDAASISPYWRRTFTDEAWREVKRDWMREQTNDIA